MDDYLSKPLRTDELRDALAACVARSVAPADAISASILASLRSETDADFVRDLKEAFYVDALRYVAELRGALPADAPRLRRAAHTLKANGATLGALGLAGLCQELEDRGESATLEGASELVERAAAELDRVIVSLKELDP